MAQAVVAEGEDLAGDRDPGDLGAAAFRDPLVLLAQGPPPVGVCAASIGAERSRCEPCLEIRPAGLWCPSCELSGSALPTRRAGERWGTGGCLRPRRSSASSCSGRRSGSGTAVRRCLRPCLLVDLRARCGGGGGDLAVEVVDQRQQTVRPPAWRSRSGTVARNWRPAFPNRSERVREVRVIAGVLKQLGEPFPAPGRLDRDLTLALRVAEQLQNSSAETRCRCHLSEHAAALDPQPCALLCGYEVVQAPPARRRGSVASCFGLN